MGTENTQPRPVSGGTTPPRPITTFEPAGFSSGYIAADATDEVRYFRSLTGAQAFGEAFPAWIPDGAEVYP